MLNGIESQSEGARHLAEGLKSNSTLQKLECAARPWLAPLGTCQHL